MSDRQFLSVREAAKMSSLSSRFLYEACARKELRFYRVGRRIVIDAADLIAFVTQNRVDSTDWNEKAKEILG